MENKVIQQNLRNLIYQDSRLQELNRTNLALRSSILLSKSNAYNIYKIRAYNKKMNGNDGPIGIEDLVLELENSPYNEIRISSIMLDDTLYVLFSNPSATTLIGFLHAP